jgi:hypothetical protein
MTEKFGKDKIIALTITIIIPKAVDMMSECLLIKW